MIAAVFIPVGHQLAHGTVAALNFCVEVASWVKRKSTSEHKQFGLQKRLDQVHHTPSTKGRSTHDDEAGKTASHHLTSRFRPFTPVFICVCRNRLISVHHNSIVRLEDCSGIGRRSESPTTSSYRVTLRHAFQEVKHSLFAAAWRLMEGQLSQRIAIMPGVDSLADYLAEVVCPMRDDSNRVQTSS